MPKLSQDNVQSYLQRLDKLTPETRPNWGKMSPAQMLGHLNQSFRYSMGDTPVMIFRGNFKTQYIYRPLLLNGILKFPKNVRLPGSKKTGTPSFPEGDRATFEGTIAEFFDAVRKNELEPPHHPFFGNIGVEGWLKFHAAHLDHHLRQFGL